ncbi:DNase I-like protein [Backusella circina FSU 941]|nr:DNase I-like protein [Backusella circina FSU 941]
MAIVPGYDCYLSFSKRRHGYSGVAVYVKQPFKPTSCEEGITGLLSNNTDMNAFLETLKTPAIQLDEEGRCLILEFDDFVLFNIYFPNDAEGKRNVFKMDYHYAVRERIDNTKKEVVLVGDVNALYAELDHFAPKEDIKERGIEYFNQLPHREWLDALVAPKGPLVDVTRRYHPERQGMFTVWNTKLNARASNMGTRIDYILVTEALAKKVTYSDIQPDIKGSDHCPVYAIFDIELNPDKEPLSTPLLTSNYSDYSSKQKKVSSYFQIGKFASSSQETMATATLSQPTILPTTKKRKTIDSFFSNNKKLKAHKQQSELEKMIEIQNKGLYPDEFKITTTSDEATTKKSTWDTLFKAPDIPVCTVHSLTCVEKTVTKKGENHGRVFYACSKPMGPPPSENNDNNNKELYNCNFFKWKKASK